MDFELNRSQKEIQKAAAEFARGEFDKEVALELDRTGAFPVKIQKKAAELGFIGVHFDEAVDGGGLGLLDAVLTAEAFCRQDSGIGVALMLAGHGAECLLRAGPSGLRKRWLSKVALGECRCAGAFSETGVGPDMKGMETTAVSAGDEWVLSGIKSNVFQIDSPGFFVVLCRTDSEGASETGLSQILVEADRKGLSWESAGAKLGMRMLSTGDLRLSDIRVPRENLVGKEGRGAAQFRGYRQELSILTAGMSLGIAQGAFDRALVHTKSRVQFGRKIAAFEITRCKLADMAVRVQSARWLTYQAAGGFDRGRVSPMAAAMARTCAAETAVAVADEALQLMGGYGYMTEYEVEHFYRDAKVLALFGGGWEKNVIADAVIGRLK